MTTEPIAPQGPEWDRYRETMETIARCSPLHTEADGPELRSRAHALLYLADRNAAMNYGETLTGATWKKILGLPVLTEKPWNRNNPLKDHEQARLEGTAFRFFYQTLREIQHSAFEADPLWEETKEGRELKLQKLIDIRRCGTDLALTMEDRARKRALPRMRKAWPAKIEAAAIRGIHTRVSFRFQYPAQDRSWIPGIQLETVQCLRQLAEPDKGAALQAAVQSTSHQDEALGKYLMSEIMPEDTDFHGGTDDVCDYYLDPEWNLDLVEWVVMQTARTWMDRDPDGLSSSVQSNLNAAKASQG